jgi:hypothetical protein
LVSLTKTANGLSLKTIVSKGVELVLTIRDKSPNKVLSSAITDYTAISRDFWADFKPMVSYNKVIPLKGMMQCSVLLVNFI